LVIIADKWGNSPLVVSYAFVFLIALAYAGFVASHFSNYPKGDDFLAILPPAIAAAENGTSALTLEEIFAQHFSHRIAPVRLLAMLQVLGFGQLNFTVFSWIGLVSWCAAFFLLAWRAGWTASAAALLCAALVWFQPEAANNSMVPMQAASNLPIILLAFGSFAIRGSGWRGSWLLAWLLGLLGLATTGNGFVVLGTLLLWDAFCKNWKALAVGIGITIFVALLYFSAFENPDSQKYSSSLGDIVGNALVMMGAIFKVGPVSLMVPMIGGFILGIWSIVVLVLAARRQDYFTAAAMVFVGGSVAMAALARAGWGNEYMLQPRYMIYPIIALATCVAYTVIRANSRSVSWGAVGLCAIFYGVCWWQGAPGVVTSHLSATAEATSWAMGYPSHRFAGDQNSNARSVEHAAEKLRRADELKIFTPDATGLVAAAGVMEGTPSEVEGLWNTAAAGYVIQQLPPDLEDHDMLLVTSPNWKQVAFRPRVRLALGRLIRGEPQQPAPLILAAPPFKVPTTLKAAAQPLRGR
jgi:hypothetical protein